MPRDTLIDRIIQLIGDTAHLPNDLKEKILANLDGLEDEVLQEMIDTITESNARLADEYEKAQTKLLTLTGKADVLVEGEKKVHESHDIEKIKSQLKEKTS